MATYKSKIVEFRDQLCVLLPDALCQEMGVRVGDFVEVTYNEKKKWVEIRTLGRGSVEMA